MLMTMLKSHASVDFLVLSFVLPCAYAYVASETQALVATNLGFAFHGMYDLKFFMQIFSFFENKK